MSSVTEINVTGKGSRTIVMELKDQTLSLETLRSGFGNNAAGLAYEFENKERAVSVEGGILVRPRMGWRADILYNVVYHSEKTSEPVVKKIKKEDRMWSVIEAELGDEEKKEEGKFVTIWNANLVTALKVPKLRVYVWKEAYQVWSQFVKIIKEPQDRLIRVVGCPGTGKSVLAWHFACHLARQGKKVVWFSLLTNLDAGYNVLLLDGKQIQQTHAFSFSGVRNILEDEQFGKNPPTVFIDGVRSKHGEFLTSIREWWSRNPQKTPVVQLQSMQLYFPKNTVDSIETERIWTDIYYHRWNILEFMEALTGDDELKQRVLPKLSLGNEITADSNVSNEELQTLVEKKAYYAGFSARNMFDLTTDQIKRDVGLALDSVPVQSIKPRSVKVLLISDSMKPLRDSLFVKQNDEQFSRDYEPASAYVLAELCSRYSMQVLSLMRQYLDNIDQNAKTLRGCIFKMYFLCGLRECVQLKKGVIAYFEGRKPREDWKVTQILECPLNGSVVLGLDKWVPSQTNGDLWIDPATTNQKGWDFAQYVKKDSLFRAVQLTVGKNHSSFGYEEVKNWIVSLGELGYKVTKCEYVYLYPEGNPSPTINAKEKEVVFDKLFRKSEGGIRSRSRLGMITWF